MRCAKCGSQIFLIGETLTHLEIAGEIVKQVGNGDLHNRNCLRCTHPEIYKEYAYLDDRTAKGRRCCRNCLHFNPQHSTCPEGGFSEIGDPDRALSEEECCGFRAKAIGEPRSCLASKGKDG
jgi:hypothetical protein